MTQTVYDLWPRSKCISVQWELWGLTWSKVITEKASQWQTPPACCCKRDRGIHKEDHKCTATLSGCYWRCCAAADVADVVVLNLLKPSFVYAVRPKTSTLVFKIKAPLPCVMPRLNRINTSVVLILWKCHSAVWVFTLYYGKCLVHVPINAHEVLSKDDTAMTCVLYYFNKAEDSVSAGVIFL